MLNAYLNKDLLEAGCDEAGRGCLSGPVFAAAVILPKDFRNEELNDSKQLSEKKRYELRDIIEKEAISWGLGIVEAHEIDKLNILNASFLAMHRAIIQLEPKPEFLLIDGNRFRHIHQIPLYKLLHQKAEEKRFEHYSDIDFFCQVKGDGKYLNIAAASILAKTYRDDYMLMLHEQNPHYNWKSNKGYPTLDHRNAIRKYGLTEHHRKSFRQLEDQLELAFGE
ncbi:MAG TPA: ribonuclease HII [Bacteroidales bacterium]|nr:ribonuclease HII [Bacteroidales bacterium]